MPVAALSGAVIGLGAIVASATADGLTYYQTPSEAVRSVERGPVRLAGLVVTGTMDRTGDVTTLVLTDGATDVTVTYAGALPAAVQEGQGAVVEGRIDDGGVFRASEIVMRHSNEYRPATP
ncbi:MAG: cytochrome c maturation protein CcmE [Mobilicoccus sp.]|nr:cytochrome c maturation protein CcmE [Mobilicoccus sp.]